MTTLGYKHTEETKRKMSELKKGKKLSKEHKRKISESLKKQPPFLKRKHTEESKTKMSKSHKGHIAWNKGKKCTPLSKEQKRKISVSLKGIKRSKEFGEKISRTKKGHEVTKETREKISKTISEVIKKGNFPNGIQGKFYSKKNKKELHYRSLLELNWYQLLEQMSKVKKYQVEPCTIPYKYDGIMRNYTPDLRIIYTDKSSELVEIKPEADYFRNNPQNKAKWKAAKRWCQTRKRTITFKVVGYEELN